MVFSITMSDDEYNFIHSYADEKKISLSEFFITSALEKIEDEEDSRIYEKAKAMYDADPVTYSHEEVKKILGLTKWKANLLNTQNKLSSR